MYKFSGILLLIICCSLMGSCNRPSPQIPSNKGNSIDKNTLSLLEINKNLAKKEDIQLKKLALQKDKSFKKSEIGFWYKINQLKSGKLLKDSSVCKINYTLFTLKGIKLRTEEKQVVIGKKQVIVGLEEGLKLMKKGESATFIIPWYLGYGMKGDEPLIPPYTSLIYEVNVFN